ncbi:MAG TPA: sialidase family protein [Burkholderiales bacterium]|nr:sialidase family protein [Burkholderiales bacterium]
MVKSHPITGKAAAWLIAALLGGAPAMPSPAAEHAHEAHAAGRNVLSLDVYAAGDTIDLLTAETAGTNGTPALWYRRSGDGGKSWSAPVRVGEGMPVPHQPHRSNDPQVASNGKQVIAVWASAGRGFRSSGPMVTALSNDGGKTWRRGPNPADDNRHDGHGFADIVARDGRFHLTWLDSRSGAQGVRYARSGDGGATWSANMSVKSGSCECCWNTLLPSAKRDVYLLYRGKGPRDMGLMASKDDGATWVAEGPVGAFNWQVEACPHTGGALARTGEGGSSRLHSLVWTGKPGERGVHYFASKDGGTRWSMHARMGGEFAQRADLAARGNELVAAWDETVGQTGAVFISRSQNAGAEWSKPMRLTSDSVSATYPRVVAARSNLLVAWTETAGGESRLRMLLLK